MRSLRLARLAGAGLVAAVLLTSPGAGRASPLLYFVHTDHLNTPRLIADQNQATVWRWDQVEPFGANPADEDPDGDAVIFYMPFRFPGQYFDKETNLHYNYFRDYDPAIGRYIQPDPVGVLLDYDDPRISMSVALGSVKAPAEVRLLFNHLYGYAQQNPISNLDPDGLRWWKYVWDAGKWVWGKVRGKRQPAKEPEYVCPPERKKRCTEAFWRCIADVSVDEKLCILAQQACITTPFPTLFPHGEWVR